MDLLLFTQGIKGSILEKIQEPHAICAGPEWADGESSSVGVSSCSQGR